MPEDERRYSLDTSSLVRAWEFYERVAKFWKALERLANDGRLVYSEEAYRELGATPLRDWIDDCEGLVVKVDEATLGALTTRVTPLYHPDVFKGGANAADPWVIATALAHGAAVVTEELPSKASKQLRIPDACARLNVGCLQVHRLAIFEDWQL